MGKPGAKKMDQIVSVTPGDVHIIMVPSPGGPVPTPIPHPCTSIIKDKIAEKVKVMGQPGAVKGSISTHTPPHIPMGPGPFQKPPANKGEIVTASSNVFYEGKEAAMLGDTGKMCADPSDAPVGKVIGTAATVLVGGGGSGSDEARAGAAAVALKAAAAACHKWVDENMPPGPEREKAHREICTATGHPVDVATGKLFASYTDLQLPGRIPLRFIRNYSSARQEVGVFGRGWRHSFECELIVHGEFIAHRDENGRLTEFPPIKVGESAWNSAGGLGLEHRREGFQIKNSEGIVQCFACPRAGEAGTTILSLVCVIDRYGNGIKLRWDDVHRLRDIQDDAGRMVTLDYYGETGLVHALKLKVDAESEVETLWTYVYSQWDQLIRCQDTVGNFYDFEYLDHLLVRETDRNGDCYFFAYNSEKWCIATWGDGGYFYRYLDYDLLRQTTRVVDSLGFSRVFDWTSDGVVTSETDPDGNVWRFEYDENFHLMREEDPIGNVWTKQYDERGRVVATEDAEGHADQYEWDAEGRLIRHVDKEGNEWCNRHSSDGWESVCLDPLGQETIEIRDDRGDLISVRLPDGTESRFSYDRSGRITSIQTPDGLHIQRMYNRYGRLVAESDEYGVRVRLGYDSFGRLSRVVYGERRETDYERDAEGRIVRLRDGRGRWTEYAYLPFVDKVKSITVVDTTAKGKRRILDSKRFEYDTEHRVTLVEVRNGGVAKYTYADHRAPDRIEYSDGRVQRYEFDARNYVTKLYENEVLVYEQESNSLGKVTTRRTGDGLEYLFEYDAVGGLVSVAGTDGVAPVEFERDAIGRLLVERGEGGEHVFTYDEGGARVDYAWNQDLELSLLLTSERGGRLWTTIRGDREEVRLEYDARIRLRQVRFAHGHEEQFSYGPDRCPLSRRISHRGETRRMERFTHDVEGLLTRVETERVGTRLIGRDALDRLTSMRMENVRETREYQYAFDSAGDRVSATNSIGRSYTEVYSVGHRLEQCGESSFEYDERGRVVAIRSPRGLTELTWDALNRLKTVRQPDGSTVEMRYDALGRRIEKSGPEGTTQFSWLDNRLVHEVLPSGCERHYLYHRSSFWPLARYVRESPTDEWTLEAFVDDLSGAPSQVINAEGQVVWANANAPWGERTETNGQPIGLQGQYLDRETGLFYNNARYYLAEAATYLSPDPIGLAGGDSTYAYVSDPLSWVDPLGLAFQRAYGGDEVRDTLDASEGRPSPETGADGHPRGEHVNRTNRQIQDRANTPQPPATVSTFESSQAQDRAATDALNSPAGQAELARLDAGETRVRIRAATGPETIRQATRGQGFITRKTSRETVVIVDVLDRSPGAERIHIQTCYGT